MIEERATTIAVALVGGANQKRSYDNAIAKMEGDGEQKSSIAIENGNIFKSNKTL